MYQGMEPYLRSRLYLKFVPNLIDRWHWGGKHGFSNVAVPCWFPKTESTCSTRTKPTAWHHTYFTICVEVRSARHWTFVTVWFIPCVPLVVSFPIGLPNLTNRFNPRIPIFHKPKWRIRIYPCGGCLVVQPWVGLHIIITLIRIIGCIPRTSPCTFRGHVKGVSSVLYRG